MYHRGSPSLLMKHIVKFFDRLEDRVRGYLSHRPILYAAIGGTGIILFWRGIWYVADVFEIGSLLSIVLGLVMLLMSGLFVTAFIGNEIIISGLKGEKKITEKTEEEVKEEVITIQESHREVEDILVRLERIEKKLDARE